jgi:RNA polymerase sigma-70 factor (ECF subfamily)
MRELIHRARNGDRQALHTLIQQLSPRLERIAAYYAARSNEEFDELRQVAWLSVLEALPEVDLDVGQPEEYLLQRGRWGVLDFLKWNRRRECEPLDPLIDSLSTDGVEQSAVTAAFIEQLCARLSQTQQAILGHLLQGRTWRETAGHLGCTSANVAYHVRAIKREYLRMVES